MRLKPGIVIASGGIDSTVLAYELKRQNALRGIFAVNYGQASWKRQKACLDFHQTKLKVTLCTPKITLPEYMRGSGAIMKGQPKVKQVDPYELSKLSGAKAEKWRKDVYDYIPGRNTLFILYGLAWARSLDLTHAYVGFQLDEPEWRMFHRAMNYTAEGADTAPGYVWAFNEFLDAGAMDRGMTVLAPFHVDQLDKVAIVKMGRRLGVDLDRTYSCEFSPPCGGCRGCLVRRKVLTSQGENVR